MKRWIHANSEIGKYKGIRYGIEDSPDQRYYFINEHGYATYADTEEELFARIDEYLEDYEDEGVEADTCVCNPRTLSYEQVKKLLKQAIVKNDRRTILDLQRSRYYDDVLSELSNAMKISASLFARKS